MQVVIFFAPELFNTIELGNRQPPERMARLANVRKLSSFRCDCRTFAVSRTKEDAGLGRSMLW